MKELETVGALRDGKKSAKTCGALIVWRDGLPDPAIPLESGAIVLGRTPDADVRLNSPFTSRRHAQIITEQDALTGERRHLIRDLGSKHGTLLNSSRVKAAFLREGDRIVIGTHFLLFTFIERTECN